VDKTQRQGVEMSVQGRWKKLRWFANYAYNQATFQTETNLASAINAAGTTVQKGDVLPNQPAHILKLGAQYVFNTQWSFGGNVQAVSSQFMRGDESNQLQKLAGYVVLNLNTNYQIAKNIGIFAKLDNVLNTDYATSGVYNRNAFAALGEGVGKVESFISPAAPRSGWLGVRINF
jgi:outer membrane receptor protein involved in Fe transport